MAARGPDLLLVGDGNEDYRNRVETGINLVPSFQFYGPVRGDEGLEIIPTDVTALGVLLFLIVARLLPLDRAFAGFGSDAVIMILGILVMVEALIRTGVTDFVGRLILRQTNTSASKILLVVMIAAAAMGAFISNTAATAFFLPIVIGLAYRAKLSPAKFLMPLAFASVLASSVTLISTSTNVIVSSLIAFSVLLTSGIVLIFVNSTRRDALHVEMVSLAGDMESRMLMSKFSDVLGDM